MYVLSFRFDGAFEEVGAEEVGRGRSREGKFGE